MIWLLLAEFSFNGLPPGHLHHCHVGQTACLDDCLRGKQSAFKEIQSQLERNSRFERTDDPSLLCRCLRAVGDHCSATWYWSQPGSVCWPCAAGCSAGRWSTCARTTLCWTFSSWDTRESMAQVFCWDLEILTPIWNVGFLKITKISFFS